MNLLFLGLKSKLYISCNQYTFGYMVSKFIGVEGSRGLTRTLTSFNEHDKELLDQIYGLLEKNRQYNPDGIDKQNSLMIRLNNIDIKDLIYPREENSAGLFKNNKYVSVGLVTNLNYKEHGKPIVIFLNNISMKAIAISEIKDRIKKKHICRISTNVRMKNIINKEESKNEYPFLLYISRDDSKLKFSYE